MGLRSKLLSGDPQLEAAAVSDPAHVKSGASGSHVGKIQTALNLLDGAVIADGELRNKSYGPATALAVLNYKQNRDIVNRSYQTKADNIVGKMTIASLDNEMVQQEALRPTLQIKPLSQSRLRAPRSPALQFAINDSLLPVRANITAGVNNGSAPVSAPQIIPNDGSAVVLEMRRNNIAKIVVIGGSFGDLTVEDPAMLKIAPDAPVVPSDKALVVDDPQTFKVFSGKTLGETKITATAFGSSASIAVVVKTFFDPPKFTEGVNHAHAPSGRYADVQANPNNGPGVFGFALDLACPRMGPDALVALSKSLMFSDKPIAKKHLDFYLKDGHGADFVEDANIREWINKDSGIRRRLKREIFPVGRKPRSEGFFFFDQSEFLNEDFHFAFGAIDRVDFAVDFSQDTVRVWFQDRYEWHPVYPFYTFKKGDGVRETNCLHAALVELKTSGAADFWMKGQAEVALSLIVKP